MSIRVTPKKIVKRLESLEKSDNDNLSFVAAQTVHAACVQLKPGGYAGMNEYLGELARLTRECADAKAQLIVFPEHTGLFFGAMVPFFHRLMYYVMRGQAPEQHELPGDVKLDYQRVLTLAESFQNYLYETYMYTFSTLARLNRVYIAAGSCLFYEHGNIYNRSVLFGPDGAAIGAQGKLSPLGFDCAVGAAPQNELRVFDTPMGRVAIIMGTDAYYFEYVKIAAERGARIIAAPCFTGGVTHEILRCRAQQMGVYILHSCLSPPQSEQARAAIYAPEQAAQNKHGVIARADSDASCFVCARLNLDKLDSIFPECPQNQAFLDGDYIHSYRYSGIPDSNAVKAVNEKSGIIYT